MDKVVFNSSNENPFYGMKNCLTLFENTGNTITTDMLNKAYKECNTKEKKELFYSLLFSIGDITARQHNIFKGKKRDSGGNANREGFHTVIDWMTKNAWGQFHKFLFNGLFNEYVSFDLLLRNRIKSDRKGKVISTYNPFSNVLYRQTIANYLYAVIKGTNPYNKHLVAKFLTLPRLTHRKGHKKMLKETYQVMWYRAKLLELLSRFMGWEYELTTTKADFKGYREWRKQYNGELESVLFSTGKIKEFTQDEFTEWLDKLPSQARYRVKNRILYSKSPSVDVSLISGESSKGEVPKYPLLKAWYLEWEKYKEEKQAEQRILEEKVRQNQATEEDLVKLQKVKKEAKVTVGATNFNDLYNDILSGRIDKLKLESFINKVNLPYNSLVIIDDSGSMWGEPFRFAQFIASVCLAKNPDDDARNLIGMFGSSSVWYSFIDSKAQPTANSLMRTKVAKTIAMPLYVPTESFYDNYQNIAAFLQAKFRGGYTNVASIPDNLYNKVQENPELLDTLKSYPIWTIISDADFNNMSNPKASMQVFFNKCEEYFGFKPFVVAIAIDKHKGRYGFSNRAAEFEGIDNFMYIPSNPAQIEQFLTNFKDMERFDPYTPLLSIYRSNRYDLVRNNVI